MASFSYNQITTLTTPGGTITFNAASGDTLLIDPAACSGLGVSSIRAPIFNKGQTDGYNILPFFEEGQHLVLAGIIRIESASTESGIVTARNTILTSTRSALKTILRADGTLNFSTGDTVTVRCEQLVGASGAWLKNFVLGLVSASAA